MVTRRARRDYLQALGLIDWTARVDGPLANAGSDSADRTDFSGSDGAAGSAQETTTLRVEPVDTHEPAETNTTPAMTAPENLDTMDWDALEAYLATFDHRGASRPVFGVGARNADVLIVGEAPGAQEDAHGVPFVGRAGKLLDRMLFAIDCSRETNVYITNICKFRPPDNRDPTPEEVTTDWPILERQIDLMAPKLVVAVGRVAAQTLLGSTEALGKMRGRLHTYPKRDLDVLVTYHPAYLLRSPQQKSKAWDDLRMIAARIAGQRSAA